MDRPWVTEPNFRIIKFDNNFTGLIKRHPELLTLNGYVGISLDVRHKEWRHEQYEVHGGVTFTHECDIDDSGIKKYWVGFDTSHYGDIIPAMIEMEKSFGMDITMGSSGSYRDFGYVKKNVVSLYRQLKEHYKL